MTFATKQKIINNISFKCCFHGQHGGVCSASNKMEITPLIKCDLFSKDSSLSFSLASSRLILTRNGTDLVQLHFGFEFQMLSDCCSGLNGDSWATAHRLCRCSFFGRGLNEVKRIRHRNLGAFQSCRLHANSLLLPMCALFLMNLSCHFVVYSSCETIDLLLAFELLTIE